MVKITGSTITMNRSDSVFITVTVRTAQGEVYELQEGDKLTFSAKKKATDSDYAIAPKLLNGNVLEITSLDTEHLAFGTYIYDVVLTTKSGYTTTIVEPSNLVIKESITSAGDR